VIIAKILLFLTCIALLFVIPTQANMLTFILLFVIFLFLKIDRKILLAVIPTISIYFLIQLYFSSFEAAIGRIFLFSNIFLASIIFITKTDPYEFRPILPQGIFLSFLISLHFFPIFMRELKNTYIVQISRGYKKGNPLPLILPLLHRIFDKAMRLSISLAARGA